MSGAAALESVERDAPDLIVLDLGLPDIDGVEVCRQVRDGRASPIWCCRRAGPRATRCARSTPARTTTSPSRSAPRNCSRASARAATRREHAAVERIDRARRPRHRPRAVSRAPGREEIRLTPKEFELLLFLAQHPGRVLTHRAILKAIWGPNAVDQPEHLRVLIGSLRKKIEPNPVAPEATSSRSRGSATASPTRADAGLAASRNRSSPDGNTLDGRRIEGEVELQHVHARLAKEAELASLGVRRHERADIVLRHAALAWRRGAPGIRRRPARCAGRIPMPRSSRGRSAPARSGWSLRAGFDVRRDGVDQLLVRRPELAAGRVRRVVRRAGRRGPRPEVARRREPLPDEPRTNDPAVPLDQLTVGLVRESDLGEAGDASG